MKWSFSPFRADRESIRPVSLPGKGGPPESPKGRFEKFAEAGNLFFKKKRAILHWPTIEEAAEWIHTHKFPEERRAEISIETLKKNIRKAYTGGKPYFSMNWRIITEGIAQQAGVTFETDGKEEV